MGLIDPRAQRERQGTCRLGGVKTVSPRLGDGVAIVTGGGSGIGRALCGQLARAGAHVFVVDVDAAAAEAVAAALRGGGGRAEAAPVDVRDAVAIRALVDRVAAEHGRLDWMFNNAGIAVAGEVLDCTLEDWERTIDVNLRGVIHGTLPAYEVMSRQGFGHIVNTASTAGLAPSPGLTAYAATKHAVVGLSTSLRAEAEIHGVRVSVVCPGLIDTPMKHRTVFRKLDREAVLAALPIAMYPVEALARDVMRGVLRNRPIIVTPLHARVIWWAYRAAPWLLRWVMGRQLRKTRAAARRP
jgi:NAD(P)-dependent dehydrogenase (short-subunit alcohol dehydrogenase family)